MLWAQICLPKQRVNVVLNIFQVQRVSIYFEKKRVKSSLVYEQRCFQKQIIKVVTQAATIKTALKTFGLDANII